MRSPKPSTLRRARTARELAFLVLTEAERTGEFATQLLESALGPSRLSAQDRRLAAELTVGVVRRKGTLDALLQPLLKRPLESLEGGLQCVLRLGAYQLVLLSGIAEHAAIHETVETAKQLGNPRWAGFVNGVLRTLSRMVTPHRQSQAAADSVPLASGEFRKLTSPLFPRPETDPVGYFSSGFGFPQWLAQRWAARFPIDELHRMGFWFNSPQPVCLRVNPLLEGASREAFVEQLRAAGVECRAGTLPESVWLDGRGLRVETLPGFAEGRFSVQDESAIHAARLLDPQPGETVLDLCAAPGGKTTHLAERMQNTGRVVAADVDAARVGMIASNAQRLRLNIIEPLTVRRDLTNLPQGPFDAVLVDVPCSNTGVLGKRPEVRWRLTPQDLVELPALQRRLLSAAMSRTRPGGRLLYSTCSIEPEENAHVVAGVLAEFPGWSVTQEVFHVPGQPADGAYQALLENGVQSPVSSFRL